MLALVVVRPTLQSKMDAKTDNELKTRLRCTRKWLYTYWKKIMILKWCYWVYFIHFQIHFVLAAEAEVCMSSSLQQLHGYFKWGTHWWRTRSESLVCFYWLFVGLFSLVFTFWIYLFWLHLRMFIISKIQKWNPLGLGFLLLAGTGIAINVMELPSSLTAKLSCPVNTLVCHLSGDYSVLFHHLLGIFILSKQNVPLNTALCLFGFL
jgi:hypothetical protein